MDELRDDHDGDDVEVNGVSIYALEERRKEIQTRLRAVVHALRDAGAVTNGYDTAFFLEPPTLDHPPSSLHERFFRRHEVPVKDAVWRKLSEQRFAFDPPDRFRVEWRVNDLGREKCLALWELFDIDEDGVWSYEDFGEYATAVTDRLGARAELQRIAGNGEMWRMCMTDMYMTDDNHRLTFDGFLRYRERIESTYPLIHELQALGISLEWRGVEKMRRIMRLVDEYFKGQDVLPFKQLQFLVAECGQHATYRELWLTITCQRLLHRCHRYFLAQKRALRLFGYKQKTQIRLTNTVLDDDSRVCRAGLLSLVLSGWIPADRTRWRSLFLQARLGIYSSLRKAKRRVGTFFEWTRKAALTGLLGVSCLQSTPERELGDYVFKVEVGSNFSTHSTVSMTYYSDADSAATLHELKYLERGAECFVYIDMMCRPSTREADARWLCQRLTWFVELYFKEHLELLPFFFKWFFTIPSKLQLRATGGGGGGGGSAGSGSAAGSPPIIRFVILFTGEMDLYAVMQSLKLPSSMQFDHLLQRLSMRWMFSHSIEEIVTNKRLVAGLQWCCRGQLDARFNRQAWSHIFRQCAVQMDDEVAMENEEREYMKSQREKQQQHQQQQQRGRQTPIANKVATPEPDQKNDRSTNESDTDWLHRLALIVNSSKELSLTWSFRDLSSVLEDNAWVKTLLTSSTFRRIQNLLSTAGAVAHEWKSLSDSFCAEFASSRFVADTVAANAAAVNASSSASAARHAVSRESSRSGLPSAQDWLGPISPGVATGQSSAGSLPFASPLGTPASLGMDSTHSGLHSTSALPEDSETDFNQEDPLEHDLLELYDMSVKALQSLHSIRAEAGTSGVSVVLEGWNIFSMLPRVVPVSATRKAPLVRTKSTMSNSSASGLVTASPTSNGQPTGPTKAVGSSRRKPSSLNA